jgi:hypothetical protein
MHYGVNVAVKPEFPKHALIIMRRFADQVHALLPP